MLLLAVVPEALAVVRQQDDQGVVVQAARAQGVEQAADDLVGVRDLAVVRCVARETVRRRVGRVRLVQMQKQEDRRTGDGRLFEPAFGHLQRIAPVTLHLDARCAGRSLRQAVVVGLETARQTHLLPEHVRRDHRGRPVAERGQELRQQRLLGTDREAQVVAHAVLDRQQPGEHRDVGRQRLRRVRIRALEQHRVGDEPVDGRRLYPLVPVGGQPIGPQGVDGDEHDRAGNTQLEARPGTRRAPRSPSPRSITRATQRGAGASSLRRPDSA